MLAQLARLIPTTVFCLAVAATSSWSCSLLLKGDEAQCQSNSDCARFPNASCNRGAGVCVARVTSTPGTSSQPTNVGSIGKDGSAADTAEAGGSAARNPDGAAASDAIGIEAIGRPIDATVPDVGRSGDLAGRECPDLDGNGILDCKESLVTNPDFKSGFEGWTPEVGMLEGFSPNDGDGNPASGSMIVTNGSRSEAAVGSTMGGSGTCVPVTGLTSYGLYLQTFFPSGAIGSAFAGVALRFFASEDCSGPLAGTFMPPLAAPDPSGWRVLQSTAQTPGGTRSMLLRLVILKPFDQPPLQALFDNVLLRQR